MAASILRQGAEPFKTLRSQGDYEFHKVLHDLRKRWILRRTSATVSGDLSYHSGKDVCPAHLSLLVASLISRFIVHAVGTV